MSTAHVEVWLRNSECNLLTDCWRADLVIQACTGKYLVDVYPEIITQLQKKYGTPASVQCVSAFPLTADQSGKTLSITVGSATAEILTFASPAQSLSEVFAQIKAYFQNVTVSIENGFIVVTSVAHGPDATITLGGDCDLVWGPTTQGAGWTIKSHYYQNAQRIMFYPGNGEKLNHLELEIPPCAYKIWCRVCHGQNEETSVVLAKLKGSHCHTVNLLLPTIKTCAAHVIHPLMDKVVYEQALADDEERLVLFKGVMFGAGLGRNAVIEQLNYRILEAQEKGDTELEARVQAVLTLAQLLPECY